MRFGFWGWVVLAGAVIVMVWSISVLVRIVRGREWERDW